MKKLTLLIDLDDIVVDLLSPWLQQYNQKHGNKLTISDITDWNVSKFAGNAIYKIIQKRGFFRHLQPHPGAVNGLRTLRKEGHNIVLASAGAGPYSLTDKALWVENFLPFLDISSNLVLIKPKHLLKGDVLFDDSPSNISNYRAAWPRAKIATIAYPYNVQAQHDVDLVTGSWRRPEECWLRFVDWIDQLSHDDP